MHHGGHHLGQGLLGLAQMGAFGHADGQLRDFLLRQESEVFEVINHVPVVHVHPVLVERIGAGHLGVQEDGPFLALAEFRPGGRGDEREGQGMGFAPGFAPDQLQPGGDVAELVTSSDLQGAGRLLAQVIEIVGLEDHVAELGVGYARLLAVDAPLHRILGQHPVHREVLAHIAQKIDSRKPADPVVVVHHPHGCPVVFEELDYLGLDAIRLGLHLGQIRQGALLVLAAGISDQARGAAEKGQRLVPGPGETHEGQEGHHIADVQAPGRGIETAVHDPVGTQQVLAQLRVA